MFNLVKGEPFIELDELVAWLYSDEWVYLRDKPIRVEFIRHMKLDTIVGFIKNQLIFRAIEPKRSIVGLGFNEGDDESP